MDISKFTMEDIFLSALKSEIDSKNIYENLASRVKNYMLKDKLKFLAGEEEKHRLFFVNIYKKTYPKKKITLPDKTIVPLPEIKIESENVLLSEILFQAMNAEKSAKEFYEEIAKLYYDKDKEIYKALKYIGMMEDVHYSILDAEKNFVESFEDMDIEWPMIHIGP